MNATTDQEGTFGAVVNAVNPRQNAWGPFAQAPLAPLAAGVLAHNRWVLAGKKRGPFADWGVRND